MQDELGEADFLRKSAATLRRISTNKTSMSSRLIQIAEHHEMEADKIEAAERLKIGNGGDERRSSPG